MTTRNLVASVSSLALVFFATAAAAQATSDGGQTVTSVQPLIVTATKRAQSVERIPETIAAISGEELAQRGAQNLDDIVKLTPGVNLTTPSGNAIRITIRGIAGEANTNPTAGILFGDISLLDSYVPHSTPNLNPFDMQDVEVLKGPQGTLFGASALNGAIRYSPRAPNLVSYGGDFYGQYGGVDHGSELWSVGGAVNLPLVSDKLALRLVAYDSGLPGWVDNVLAGVKNSNRGRQDGERAILTVKPSQRFTATATFARQKTRVDDIADEDNLVGALTDSNKLRQSPQSEEFDLASLRLDVELGAFDLVSETGYVYKNFVSFSEGSSSIIPGGDFPLVNTNDHEHSQSYSEELRLVSKDTPGSKWSWVAGFFISRQDIWQDGGYFLGSPDVSPLVTAGYLNEVIPGAGNLWLFDGQPPYTNGHIEVDVKEVAGFFDVTRKLGRGFELSLGGRLYKTSSGGLVDNTGLLLDLNTYITSGGQQFVGSQVLNDRIEDSGFNPKVSLTWRPNDDIMLYGTVSRGYRVGGVQWGNSGLLFSAPTPPLFKTDTIWNYEVGLRSTWLDHTLQFDLTAFYERWRKPQVLVFVTGGLGAYIDNAGGVDSKGVEASLQYHPRVIPGLSLRGSATYDDARTTSAFVTAVGSVLVPSGSPWPLSPKWQTAATIDYTHDFGAGYWGGYVTDSYISHAQYGIGQPDQVFGYNQVDAQVRIGSANLPLRPELAFMVTNLFDRRGVGTSYSGLTAIGGVPWHEVTYIQPRTFTVRISGSF